MYPSAVGLVAAYAARSFPPNRPNYGSYAFQKQSIANNECERSKKIDFVMEFDVVVRVKVRNEGKNT